MTTCGFDCNDAIFSHNVFVLLSLIVSSMHHLVSAHDSGVIQCCIITEAPYQRGAIDDTGMAVTSVGVVSYPLQLNYCMVQYARVLCCGILCLRHDLPGHADCAPWPAPLSLLPPLV